ncbi:uncharacterized protein tnc [Panulirus ornatus]|uniref:uncharacterized protein tnc n=1 Tax=Panulirus ornatus TaxID=150431 RepID=UPI003A847F1C
MEDRNVFLAVLLLLVCLTTLTSSAPFSGDVFQQQQADLSTIFHSSKGGVIGPLFRTGGNETGQDGTEGCYYQFQPYAEGDRIVTNEPCLNCTCHNSMLMCYLKVCPFSKPIGENCTIENITNQCCPVITCPQVPVNLQVMQMLTSTTTPSPSYNTTDMAIVTEHGCTIEGQYYPDGAQVPGDPTKPCELCYCIRNHTACVMQECILMVPGCKPVFKEGICCPVRYDCAYDESEDGQLVTTTAPLVAGNNSILLPTTTMPTNLVGCVHKGEYYADGALIPSENPCEHCYCMKSDLVCAIQECLSPLDDMQENCTQRDPPPGKCCPEAYDCPEVTTVTLDYSTLATQPSGVTGDVTEEYQPVTVTPVTPSDLDAQTSQDGEPEGHETTSDVPTGAETSTDVPTGAETSTDVPTGAETSTDVPTGAETSTDVPTGAETSTDVPTGAETGTGVPTGAETSTDVPTGAETSTDVPIGAETSTDVPTGAETGTGVPTGAETSTGVPTGAETSTDVPTGAETSTGIPTGAETSTGIPTGAETSTGVPTGAETSTDVPTGAETGTDVPTGAETSTGIPTGAETSTDVSTGAETSTDVPTGAETSTDVPTGAETSTDVPTGAETSTGVPTGAETSTGVPTGAETSTDVPTGAETSTGVPTGAETSTGVPTGAETSTGVPTEAETSTGVPTGGETSTDVPTGAETSTGVPTGAETSTGVPTGAETSTDIPTEAETSTGVPTGAETSTGVPTGAETSTDVPTGAETSTDVPTGAETSTDVPTGAETSTDVPTGAETSTDVPTGAETSTDVPTGAETSTGVPTGAETSTGGTDTTLKPSTVFPLEAGGCAVNGTQYSDGADVPVSDPCQESCQCIAGMVKCVQAACPPAPPSFLRCSPVHVPGECCPVHHCLPAESGSTISPGCVQDGIQYFEGEFVPSSDFCSDCYCLDGQIVCAYIECDPSKENCEPLEVSKGECCPTKYNCDMNVTIDSGNLVTDSVDEVTTSTPFTIGSTGEASEVPGTAPVTETSIGTKPETLVTQPVITTEATGATNTVPVAMETRTTAPDEEILTTPVTLVTDGTEGVNITEDPSKTGGDTLATKPSTGVEETATDAPAGGGETDTGVDETTILAPTEVDETASGTEGTVTGTPIVPGDGVPGEGSCIQNGTTFNNGALVPGSTPCHQSCTCKNSIVECSLKTCPPAPPTVLNCRPKQEPNQCCPSYHCPSVDPTPYPGCIRDEVLYSEGEYVPSPDLCTDCYCISGEVICAKRDCPPPTGTNCTPVPPAEGSCCPTEYHCDTDVDTTTQVTSEPEQVDEGSLTTDVTAPEGIQATSYPTTGDGYTTVPPAQVDETGTESPSPVDETTIYTPTDLSETTGEDETTGEHETSTGMDGVSEPAFTQSTIVTESSPSTDHHSTSATPTIPDDSHTHVTEASLATDGLDTTEGPGATESSVVTEELAVTGQSYVTDESQSTDSTSDVSGTIVTDSSTTTEAGDSTESITTESATSSSVTESSTIGTISSEDPVTETEHEDGTTYPPVESSSVTVSKEPSVSTESTSAGQMTEATSAVTQPDDISETATTLGETAPTQQVISSTGKPEVSEPEEKEPGDGSETDSSITPTSSEASVTQYPASVPSSTEESTASSYPDVETTTQVASEPEQVDEGSLTTDVTAPEGIQATSYPTTGDGYTTVPPAQVDETGTESPSPVDETTIYTPTDVSETTGEDETTGEHETSTGMDGVSEPAFTQSTIVTDSSPSTDLHSTSATPTIPDDSHTHVTEASLATDGLDTTEGPGATESSVVTGEPSVTGQSYVTDASQSTDSTSDVSGTVVTDSSTTTEAGDSTESITTESATSASVIESSTIEATISSEGPVTETEHEDGTTYPPVESSSVTVSEEPSVSTESTSAGQITEATAAVTQPDDISETATTVGETLPTQQVISSTGKPEVSEPEEKEPEDGSETESSITPTSSEASVTQYPASVPSSTEESTASSYPDADVETTPHITSKPEQVDEGSLTTDVTAPEGIQVTTYPTTSDGYTTIPPPQVDETGTESPSPVDETTIYAPTDMSETTGEDETTGEHETSTGMDIVSEPAFPESTIVTESSQSTDHHSTSATPITPDDSHTHVTEASLATDGLDSSEGPGATESSIVTEESAVTGQSQVTDASQSTNSTSDVSGTVVTDSSATTEAGYSKETAATESATSVSVIESSTVEATISSEGSVTETEHEDGTTYPPVEPSSVTLSEEPSVSTESTSAGQITEATIAVTQSDAISETATTVGETAPTQQVLSSTEKPAVSEPEEKEPSSTEKSPLPSYLGTDTTTATPWTPTTVTDMVLGPGACLFDGKVYVSAQQIPRKDPCDFCFCFRSDIICLQQSCPPPIPGCYEEAITGYCCPRYECPVTQSVVNITTTTTPIPIYPPVQQVQEVVMCEISDRFYHAGELVEEASGPCLECRCGYDGMMECDPKECQAEPMLRKILGTKYRR